MRLEEAPGTWSGVVGTNQCRLGSPRRGRWSKPRGDEVWMTKCDLALGTDRDMGHICVQCWEQQLTVSVSVRQNHHGSKFKISHMSPLVDIWFPPGAGCHNFQTLVTRCVSVRR